MKSTSLAWMSTLLIATTIFGCANRVDQPASPPPKAPKTSVETGKYISLCDPKSNNGYFLLDRMQAFERYKAAVLSAFDANVPVNSLLDKVTQDKVDEYMRMLSGRVALATSQLNISGLRRKCRVNPYANAKSDKDYNVAVFDVTFKLHNSLTKHMAGLQAVLPGASSDDILKNTCPIELVEAAIDEVYDCKPE